MKNIWMSHIGRCTELDYLSVLSKNQHPTQNTVERYFETIQLPQKFAVVDVIKGIWKVRIV